MLLVENVPWTLRLGEIAVLNKSSQKDGTVTAIVLARITGQATKKVGEPQSDKETQKNVP